MSDTADAREKSEEFPRLAVLTGADDIDSIVKDRAQPLTVEGNNDMTKLVAESRFKWLRFHITPGYYEQPLRYNVKNRHLLCNIVSDPDYNPRVLKTVERMANETGLPVLNRPEQVMRTSRDGVAELLAGIPGLVVPKVLRLPSPSRRQLREGMEQRGFRFPALVRVPGSHNGEFLGLFDTPEELEPSLDRSEEALLIIEFVDFAWPDGLYRKDRIMFIGEKIMPRHRVTSNVWNLHGRDKRTLMDDDESLVEEERQVIAGGFDGLQPITQSALSTLRERMGLDYFGIDCNLQPDGTVILFEANATTNFFPLGRTPVSAYLKPLLLPVAVAAFEKMVEDLARSSPRAS